jgi:uncharacterized alpha/beta hydrolase family protein
MITSLKLNEYLINEIKRMNRNYVLMAMESYGYCGGGKDMSDYVANYLEESWYWMVRSN